MYIISIPYNPMVSLKYGAILYRVLGVLEFGGEHGVRESLGSISNGSQCLCEIRPPKGRFQIFSEWIALVVHDVRGRLAKRSERGKMHQQSIQLMMRVIRCHRVLHDGICACIMTGNRRVFLPANSLAID